MQDPILILDGYGRGAWLASELADRGLPVRILDCRMGSWAVEDEEGPFGIFMGEALKDSQKGFLMQPYLVEPCERGFCIKIGRQTFEFHGPFLRHLKDQLGLTEAIFDSLKKVSEPSSSWDPKWSWENKIYNLACQYSATRFIPNTQADQLKTPAPLALPLYLRRVSRGESPLTWLREKGVQVFSETKLQDISVSRAMGRATSMGLEIQSKEFSGYVAASQVVCFLSAEELSWMNAGIADTVYRKILTPQWSWIRYRFRFPENPSRSGLPRHWLQIADADLPWTHENFLICNSTYDPGLWDIWCRVPVEQRFRVGYLQEISKKIGESFTQRFGVAIELHEAPQESRYVFSDLGPSPYPVYGEKQKPPAPHVRNWLAAGPESYPNHDGFSLMRSNDKLLEPILAHQQKMDAKTNQREMQ